MTEWRVSNQLAGREGCDSVILFSIKKPHKSHGQIKCITQNVPLCVCICKRCGGVWVLFIFISVWVGGWVRGWEAVFVCVCKCIKHTEQIGP